MYTKKPYHEQLVKELSFIEGFSCSKPQYEILEAFKKMSLLKTKKDRVQVVKELLVVCQKELGESIKQDELASFLTFYLENLCFKTSKDLTAVSLNLLLQASSFSFLIYKTFCKKLNFPLPEPVLVAPQKRVLFPGTEAYVKS